MPYFFLILKRNILLLLTAASLVLCATAVALMNKAIKIAQDPILIAIDSNGTRVISKSDDPIFDTEAIQFAKMFVGKIYNFTPQNIADGMNETSGFLSIELWDEEQSKFRSTIDNAIKNQIFMTGSIQRVVKHSQTEYTIYLKNQETTRATVQDRNISLKLYLQRVQRTQLNPYGIEVHRYEENVLN